MTAAQNQLETDWSGRPLLVDAMVLNEEQIGRAARCVDPADSGEAAWTRYLRALALEGLKEQILRQKLTITLGPELEPEAPGRLLAVNGIATQLVCCTDLADFLEVDLSPWRQEVTAPQMLLAVQVDEDNGVVRVPGVLKGSSFVAQIKQEWAPLDAETVEVPLHSFTGGVEKLLRWTTLLPASAFPRLAVTPEGSASRWRYTARLDEWVKRLLQEAPTPIPLLVSGARSTDLAELGLINPRVELNPQGEPVALAVCSTPTIWADRPLAEILIERDGMPVWQKLATSKEPIEGPIAWPLEPLLPGGSFILKLRPYGATGGVYAKANLLAPDPRTLSATDELLTRWTRLQHPSAPEGIGEESDTIIGTRLEFAARRMAALEVSNLE